MALVHSHMIPLGARAFNFLLLGTDGKKYSLADFTHKKALVIVFTCNHCPYAKASWPILIKLANQFKNSGVQFVAINANDGENYPDDNFEAMKKEVKKRVIPFPYLHDESQDVAKQYKAVCTPDIYVFNSGQKLVYRGRINDNWQNPEAVISHDLRNALEEILKGKKPSTDQKPSMGCSIKWKE